MNNTTKIATLSDIQNIKYLLDNSEKVKIRESKYEIVVFVKKQKPTDTDTQAQEEIRSKIYDLIKED